MKRIRSTTGRKFTSALLATLRHSQTTDNGSQLGHPEFTEWLETRRNVAPVLGQVYELFEGSNPSHERHLSHLRIATAGSSWFRSVAQTTILDEKLDYVYCGLDLGEYELEAVQPIEQLERSDAPLEQDSEPAPIQTYPTLSPLDNAPRIGFTAAESSSLDWALNAS